MQSDAMDIDMKGEEISRKESTPSDLLGFVYNMSYKQTSMVTVSPHKDKYKTARHKVSDYASAVLNSSNGVLLLYVSTFLKASPPNSQFMVKHPFTTDRVAVHILPTWANLASPKRFLVYGFVFDPKSPHLSFDIVEVSDTSSPRPGCLLSNRICSLDTPCMWRPQKVHNGDKLVRLLGENYVFSGMSTYLNGALHWLVEPSGVIAYNLQEDRFKTFLLNIPGDMLHVNEYGLCNCLTNSSTKTIGINATSTTSVCNCRYLGESRDKLVYARVTGDSEFSVWILEDYHAGTWSNRHQVRVNRLTKSLFGGRVLAFSRSDAHLVFLRVDERRIVSYNYMTGEMKEVGVLKKTYKGDDRWDGFVVPLEASMLTPRVTQPAGQPIKGNVCHYTYILMIHIAVVLQNTLCKILLLAIPMHR